MTKDESAAVRATQRQIRNERGVVTTLANQGLEIHWSE